MHEINKNDFLTKKSTIREAIILIERSKNFIAPVLDKNKSLIGIVSDGDIRRALLSGFKLEDLATHAMKIDPILIQSIIFIPIYLIFFDQDKLINRYSNLIGTIKFLFFFISKRNNII